PSPDHDLLMSNVAGEAQMRLYGIVPAVIGLLQCEGRVSYRALQVEFALDAATLEALKVELITVKQLAVDQDGEMLVGCGIPLALPTGPLSLSVTTDATGAPLPAPSTVPAGSTLPVSPSDGSEAASTFARSTPDTERRQVTVLFCDLVDS